MWNYYIERKKKNSGVILQITKKNFMKMSIKEKVSLMVISRYDIRECVSCENNI